MGKALYRTYRSKSLDEVIGQDHITSTLKNAIKNGQISHAYLFTGPRGVGKTSVARIIAHEINKLPYKESEDTHLDIIEIDAASNRRIDEIRDLKEKVQIAPTSAKYKVYIIDEVHMLTNEAFNALLKTLEEPPAHVVFILATTEVHKLPETIISRVQRHTFKPVEKAKVVEHLASIASQEKIKIDQQALEILADHGEGSFRDSISLLDQLGANTDKINKELVEIALGIAPADLVNKCVLAIDNKDKQEVDKVLEAIKQKGLNILTFAHQLSARLRSRFIEQKEITTENILLLEEISKLGSSSDPTLSFMLAVYRPLSNKKTSNNSVESDASTKTIIKDSTQEKDRKNIPKSKPISMPPEQAREDIPDKNIKQDNAVLDEWGQLLKGIKGKHNTLYGLVRMADPTFTEDELVLRFAFPFHARRMKDDKNKRKVEKILASILGKQIRVRSEVTAKNFKPKLVNTEPAKDNVDINNDIKNVSNIFGSAEIVES